MKRSTYVERLARVPLFRVLAKKDLALVARHAEQVRIPAGKEIVREGGTGYEFFVIASGRATVKRKGRKVAALKLGDHFGELALLGAGTRNASVVAETDMDLYVLGRRDFAALLREVPEVAVKLLQGLAQRLSESDSKPRR
jgi:CRP-like cAMP-binding protein